MYQNSLDIMDFPGADAETDNTRDRPSSPSFCSPLGSHQPSHVTLRNSCAAPCLPASDPVAIVCQNA